MMLSEMQNCPNCGASEFESQPNQYDVFSFYDGQFEIVKSEGCDDELFIFCRECGEEVDIDLSIQNKKVTLKQ